ncbi:MAG: DUF1223 domain-containing protein [bacterium]|nr:DUF1223 domain-containing protein [bacterium]
MRAIRAVRVPATGLLLVGTLLVIAPGSGGALPDPPALQNGAIVVELFTSQGCSSCPSADRYLSELAAREDLEIIPLSFHVDYWNYIGWTDPLSSDVWSSRQRRYARVFGGSRVYTPQMVVNGRWEGVGSDRRDISRLLEMARNERSAATIGVSAELISKSRLRVSVTTAQVDGEVVSESLAAWIAVVESDLVTEVGRGENASKTLHNDRVVRRLEAVPELELIGTGAEGSVEIALDEGWRRKKLSVVAFLQDAEAFRIQAAAEYGLADVL